MQQEVSKSFFSPGGDESDVVMQRVLRVCLESGYRKRGIFKCMDENRNFWIFTKELPGVLERFPWFSMSCEAHDMFFENLLRAIRPTFPDVGRNKSFLCSGYPQSWPGRSYGGRLMRFALEDPESVTECLERVLQVCDPDTVNDGLLRRMDENRGMLQALNDAPGAFERVSWIGGWLEDNDIFFENLFNALSGLFRHGQRSDSYPRPWPGQNHDRYLIRFEFNPVRWRVSDPIRNPAHYIVYPIQPIEITRHLGFCLGNAVKSVLRAPYKGGVEDIHKALRYLEWEKETPTPQGCVTREAYENLEAKIEGLVNFLYRQAETSSETPWLKSIMEKQADFLVFLPGYLKTWMKDSLSHMPYLRIHAENVAKAIEAPHCRVCGCTDDHAREGGCRWVEEDLCSSCVESLEQKADGREWNEASVAQYTRGLR